MNKKTLWKTVVFLIIGCNIAVAGSLKFAKTKFELGRMALGSNSMRITTIRNTGKTPVKILKVNSNCGCTTGRAAKQMIPPGKTVELFLVSKITKMGKQTGTVFVYTDAPDQACTVVQTKMEGYKPIKSQPEYIQFGDVLHGHDAQKTFSLTLPKQKKFKVAKIRYNENLFNVTTDKKALASEANKIAICIHLKAKAPVCRFRESLNIDLATEPPTSCAVAIYGNIQSDLAASPGSILFMGVTPGETAKRTVQIKSRSGRKFKILSAKSNLKSLDVQVETKVNGQTELIATLHSSPTDKNTNGIITLTTDNQLQPTLEIPVRIHFRRKISSR